MPITGLAIAAGLGLAKSELVDAPKAERQRKLAASTQRLSPWTGLKANPVQEADPFGTALQFGGTGAAMGSNYDSAQTDKAMANSLNTGGSLTGSGTNLYAPSQQSQPYYLGNYGQKLGSSGWDGY